MHVQAETEHAFLHSFSYERGPRRLRCDVLAILRYCRLRMSELVNKLIDVPLSTRNSHFGDEDIN